MSKPRVRYFVRNCPTDVPGVTRCFSSGTVAGGNLLTSPYKRYDIIGAANSDTTGSGSYEISSVTKIASSVTSGVDTTNISVRSGVITINSAKFGFQFSVNASSVNPDEIQSAIQCTVFLRKSLPLVARVVDVYAFKSVLVTADSGESVVSFDGPFVVDVNDQESVEFYVYFEGQEHGGTAQSSYIAASYWYQIDSFVK